MTVWSECKGCGRTITAEVEPDGAMRMTHGAAVLRLPADEVALLQTSPDGLDNVIISWLYEQMIEEGEAP